MFESLRHIANNIASIDINSILNKLWKDTVVQDFILEELNQDNQLRKGLKSDGGIVGQYVSDAYANFKQARPGRRAPKGIVDLYVTGDFYRTFRVIPINNGFEITANTSLYEDTDFAVKYGDEILGLSQDSILKLQEFLIPLIRQEILKVIRG